MAVFPVRRLPGMAITLALVSLTVFPIIELPPGDHPMRHAFRKFTGTGVAVTPADFQAIRVERGLDAPMMVRCWAWITGIVLRCDFGQACCFPTSGNNGIDDDFRLIMGLLVVTLLLTCRIAIPVGLHAAVHRGSGADDGLTVFSHLGLALPSLLLAPILLHFANRWFDASIGGAFPDACRDAPWSAARLRGLIKHLWIPAFVRARSATAHPLQTVRATMSDELGKLSVTAARALGLPETRLVAKHPARLAINLVVSTIGFDGNRIFPELPIVAAVLGLPEPGDLLLKSFLDLDMNVAGALLRMPTVVIVVMSFVSDLLLAWADPRIRLEG